jgi:hypothetical protein
MLARAKTDLRRIVIRATAIVLVLGSVGWACNVPVFRYALEHWRPDPFRATVFHRGPLTDGQQALVARIAEQQWKFPRGDGVAGLLRTNVVVRTMDVDQIAEEADRTLAAAIADLPLPRVVSSIRQPCGSMRRC